MQQPADVAGPDQQPGPRVRRRAASAAPRRRGQSVVEDAVNADLVAGGPPRAVHACSPGRRRPSRRRRPWTRSDLGSCRRTNSGARRREAGRAWSWICCSPRGANDGKASNPHLYGVRHPRIGAANVSPVGRRSRRRVMEGPAPQVDLRRGQALDPRSPRARCHGRRDRHGIQADRVAELIHPRGHLTEGAGTPYLDDPDGRVEAHCDYRTMDLSQQRSVLVNDVALMMSRPRLGLAQRVARPRMVLGGALRAGPRRSVTGC